MKSWSVVWENGYLTFPPMAVQEYKLENESFIYLVSGSKQTSGFCVMPNRLLFNSKLKNILEENLSLADRSLQEGVLLPHKGRKYTWLRLKDNGIYLPEPLMQALEIKIGDKLLSIKSSNIAFTMGLKGSLVNKANECPGGIEIY